jgi:hypothetical protein
VRPTFIVARRQGENLPLSHSPRQYPLVLLVKAGWKQGRTFDSGDGRHSVSFKQP